MRRKERNTTIRIWLWAILFVLVMVSSGCGLAADGVNHIRAIQFDPGDLYSPEFYQTARPEDVKAAIGGRSLAHESFRAKQYAANTEGSGFLKDLDEKINQVTSVFIPMSSVEVSSSAVYPLDVAIRNSPYPEVIRIMLEAGADVRDVPVPRYVAASWANDDVTKMLLERATPKQRCGSLISLAGVNDRGMVDFCLELEGADINCEENGSTPIRSALWNDSPAMAAYLLERGARLPESPDAQYDLLSTALHARRPGSFRFLLDNGMDTAKAASPRQDSLLTAKDYGLKDEDMLLHLARTVPLDGKTGEKALSGAAGLKNRKVLDIVLQRFKKSGVKGEMGPALLGVALRSKDADLFRRLAAIGADASQVDASGRNELMRVAYQNFRDSEILQLLARHVPLDERNGDMALRYAVASGFAEPVRILLERGAVPDARNMGVPKEAEDGETIRAMLREKGFL